MPGGSAPEVLGEDLILYCDNSGLSSVPSVAGNFCHRPDQLPPLDGG